MTTTRRDAFKSIALGAALARLPPAPPRPTHRR
jgi:hypothetical protein